MIKPAVTYLLPLLFCLSASAHSWDPVPCEIGVWSILIDSNEKARKDDYFSVLRALSAENSSSQFFEIAKIENPAFTQSIQIHLLRKSTGKRSEAEMDFLKSFAEEMKSLEDVTLACDQPMPAPRMSGSN